MIYQEIKKTIVEAMKRGDKQLVETLRSLDAEIQNKAITLKTSEITDGLVVGVLQKGIKQRMESYEAFMAGGRDDLATNEKIQASNYKFFLPEMMSEEDIAIITNQTICDIKQTGKLINMGMVIKIVQAETKGLADGATISKIVKNLLTQGV